ncbi:MAG: multidrug ABC transporter substrate-binding protein [Acidobacteria bacterium]|nr:MAG: multidrug ABC transporter substrate-binding protein [Acidobacteriota bacterium]
MNSFFRKLSWLAQRRRKDDELREELQFHLDAEAEQQGLPEQEARYAARRELGNLTRLREETRSAWGWTTLEQFAQDLRYAFRTMGANKLFSLLAILSLALGIGANTAIYSFMDAILLRSLPVSDPGSLALMNWRAKQVRWGTFVLHSINGGWYDDPDGGATSGIFPFPAFELFQKADSAFSAVFAYRRARRLNVAVKGQAYLASAEYVSGDYFRGLAVPPDAGRLIIPDDDRVGAPPVAVVSFAFSQRSFGGPANAAGQSVLINNVPFVIAGVTPPGFFGVDPAAAPDVFLPLHLDLLVESASQYGTKAEEYLDKNFYWIEVMGRLRPGVSLTQAQATLAPAFANWVAGTASTDVERANLPWLVLKPGAAGLESLRRRYSRPLYVLMALVGLILAIACANVASLLLARAAARRREIALRLSVGAGRFRVVRQLLTESVLLASLGGVVGIGFAVWGMRFLTLLLANGNADFTLHAELNWHVLGVAVALSLLTGVLFGLAPAVQATRLDVISAMKETRAGQQAARHPSWRISLSHVLVVGQIAISLLMLVAAALFVRTLTNLQSIDVGFNRENLLLFNLNAHQAGRQSAEIAGFYGDLLKQFKSIPGVREASLSNHSLINAGFGLGHSIPGKKPNPADRMLVIGPSFFKTMQIPMVAGREIDERDLPGSQPVAVISEQFAKVNFGSENPIGRHVILSGRRDHPETSRDLLIVGIATNARYGGLKREVPPVLYIPYNQGFPQPEEMVFELRTAGDPLAYVNTVREIVRQADTRVPLSNVRTQVAEIDQTINQEIIFAELCTAFAILALVIACVGLYGTVSYNVERRTGEIGIRMALGAKRARVVRMILVQVLALAAVGLVIGVSVAFGASKLVASFLFGMKPNDPIAITAAVVILLAAAALAGYAPARRASRIDPMVALRHE